MAQQRLLYKDGKERISTAAHIIWCRNYINQRRQFATDGVKWFYQPDNREPFILVSRDDMPPDARRLLQSELIASFVSRENHLVGIFPTVGEISEALNISVEECEVILETYLEGQVLPFKMDGAEEIRYIFLES